MCASVWLSCFSYHFKDQLPMHQGYCLRTRIQATESVVLGTVPMGTCTTLPRALRGWLTLGFTAIAAILASGPDSPPFLQDAVNPTTTWERAYLLDYHRCTTIAACNLDEQVASPHASSKPENVWVLGNWEKKGGAPERTERNNWALTWRGSYLRSTPPANLCHNPITPDFWKDESVSLPKTLLCNLMAREKEVWWLILAFENVFT